MTVAIAGAWLGAGLLIAAGAAKVRRPAAARSALALGDLPRHDWLVRLLGLGEVVVGALVLTVGGWWFALEAVVFASFTVFVLRRLRDPAASCGCFGGDDDVPLTATHALLDGAITVAAVAALPTAAQTGSAVVSTSGGLVTGVLVAGLITLGVALVRALLVDLPVLFEALRTVEEST